MTRGKFDELQAKLMKRLMMWGDMSQGGNEILITAVAQALPSFIMGVFKLPFSLCDDLTRLINQRILVGHRKREEEDALGELGYSGSGEAPWSYEVQRHEIF
jgi:hypothetical protein